MLTTWQSSSTKRRPHTTQAWKGLRGFSHHASTFRPSLPADVVSTTSLPTTAAPITTTTTTTTLQALLVLGCRPQCAPA